MTSRLRVVVVCPHFLPDTAPTGEVMTRIVAELTKRDIEVHVVTALPWYRNHAIENGWRGRLMRREDTAWGSITRVHPFPGKDKRSLVRRALGFVGFSVLATVAALRAGGMFRRVHVVLAMSPPLTLGLTAWVVGSIRRAPAVFNVQDIFPDAAIETGAITNRRVISLARWLERFTYNRSRAVVVLSDDMQRNVSDKMAPSRRDRVVAIPNFVDSDAIVPCNRMTAYRAELGIGEEQVVMYAGNVGFSQSLDLLVECARRIPDATFVINGEGSARGSLMESARELSNVVFAPFQPRERLAEVLATGDIHFIPLRRGLGNVSVPSKTYSILAAARPIVASIDAGTEVPRILDASGAGIAVPPDDVEACVVAVRELLADPVRAVRMGESGRDWVVAHVSPSAVGQAYADLLSRVSRL